MRFPSLVDVYDERNVTDGGARSRLLGESAIGRGPANSGAAIAKLAITARAIASAGGRAPGMSPTPSHVATEGLLGLKGAVPLCVRAPAASTATSKTAVTLLPIPRDTQ
jgi:hypothetical protein